MRTKHLIGLMLIASTALVEVACLRNVDIRPRVEGGPALSIGTSPEASPVLPYDVTKLRQPAGKYLGVSVKGGADMSSVAAFASHAGKKPNLVSIFEGFGDGFAASEVRKVYEYGGMAVIRWEPFDILMRDIAAGAHDEYITTFATAVRTLNLPIVLTFAHEMNGHWYSWGTRTNTAAEYVAAWRRVHGIFQERQATNVLWTWTPNVINPVRNVKLAPLYPGDAYVDWVGIDGYLTTNGQRTFASLFGPTMAQVRTITTKPMIIMETGAEPSSRRPAQIRDLLSSVARSKDLIGVVYFNIDGSGKWNLDRDQAALAALGSGAADPVFGFTVRDYHR